MHIYRNPLTPEEEDEQIQFDYYYAAVPGILVLLFLWAYLCSFFLAITSIVIIVATYPPTLLIYHGLFQISYQSYTTYLASLVFIPVATHNIFLYASAWEFSRK